MHPSRYTVSVCLLVTVPVLASAQSPAGPSVRHAVFEQLDDNQWVRLAGPEIGRRQGRVSGHTSTEIVLAAEPDPLRLPVTAVDTVWTRGRHTVAGAIAGAVVFGALGAVAGTELGEENAGTARNVIGMAGIGAIGGALLGTVIGTAIPRWVRRFP